jgi:thioredoxin 1
MCIRKTLFFPVIYMLLCSFFIIVSCNGLDPDAKKEVIRESKEVKQDPVQKEGIHFKHIPLENALEMAAKENKMVFIDYYADWCQPCKMMDKNVFANQVIYEFFNKNFINVKMDVEDGAFGQKAAAKHNVMAMPTLMLIDPEKGVVMNERGYRDVNGLLTAVQNAMGSR